MAPDVPYRYARTKKLIGQILKEMKAVHEGMIQEALTVQREEGGQIGQILIRLGHLDEATLQTGLARQAGIEMFDLASVQITSDLLERPSGNSISQVKRAGCVRVLFSSSSRSRW